MKKTKACKIGELTILALIAGGASAWAELHLVEYADTFEEIDTVAKLNSAVGR